MKRYLITAAILAAVTPAIGQSSPPQLCQQFNMKGDCITAPGGGSGALTSGSSNTITLPRTTRTCTITYEKGQVHTDDCDFSMPMTKARITPDSNKLKIEFEQQTFLSTSSTISTIKP